MMWSHAMTMTAVLLSFSMLYMTACTTAQSPTAAPSEAVVAQAATTAPQVIEDPHDVYEGAPLLSPIYFDYESAALDERDRRTLDRFIQEMNQEGEQNQLIKLVLVGHSDEPGDENYNTSLGKKRARAVRDYLIFQGLDPSRLVVESQGHTKLAVNTNGAQRHWRNRRVEFMSESGFSAQNTPASQPIATND